MEHVCVSSSKPSYHAMTWFTRWVKKLDGWRLYKVCDRCAANPNCSPQIIISLNRDVYGLAHVEHVLYQMAGKSPFGISEGKFLSLEIGLVRPDCWQVVSARELTDRRLITLLDEEIETRYGLVA